MNNPFQEIDNRLERIELLLSKLVDEKKVEINSEINIIDGKELCKKLGITIVTLIRWKAKGKVPYLQIGGLIRYNLSEVLKALENKKSYHNK